MFDEPPKKRLKSAETTNDEEMINLISLSTCDHEDESNQENIVDKQIEQEEKAADNIVIKDLMGSVKPESNKKMSDEERRELYDNVYSKLLTLLERCQKYVHHLNTKVKQSLAEHQQNKKSKYNKFYTYIL
ncbi:unnamed protein product [Adineta steineri]|uniref:Uncharacterized protein n=1 Tax=Adineta steineri TaxID=433720 RepID=A0A820N4U2_9BILA|nr:unnamed protein product [Adineta steineri]